MIFINLDMKIMKMNSDIKCLRGRRSRLYYLIKLALLK